MTRNPRAAGLTTAEGAFPVLASVGRDLYAPGLTTAEGTALAKRVGAK